MMILGSNRMEREREGKRTEINITIHFLQLEYKGEERSGRSNVGFVLA